MLRRDVTESEYQNGQLDLSVHDDPGQLHHRPLSNNLTHTGGSLNGRVVLVTASKAKFRYILGLNPSDGMYQVIEIEGQQGKR